MIKDMGKDMPIMIERDSFCDMITLLKGRKKRVLARILEELQVLDGYKLVYVGDAKDICKSNKLFRREAELALNQLIENGFLCKLDDRLYMFNTDIMYYDEDVDNEEKEALKAYNKSK